MKNILINFAAIILVSLSFCCKDKGEPQPELAQNKPVRTLVEQNVSARIQDTILIAEMNQVVRFHWLLVKTSVIKNDQSQSLKSPFLVGGSNQYEVSLELHDNCCSELTPSKASFLNLGNIDIKSITKLYLRSQTFNKNRIYTAQPSNNFWPNQLYAGTVIACKTADGNYSLLKIKSVKSKESIEVEIYQGVN